MMKIKKAFSFTKEHDYVNECIIAATKVKDSLILAKNRDRNYVPLIEIVNEVREETEILYLLDKMTNWMEGINEHGVCIINSALAVELDEAEIEAYLASGEISKSPDGYKIRHALTKKSAKDAVKDIINNDYKEIIEDKEFRERIKGHTIVADRNEVYHIESDGKDIKKTLVKLKNKDALIFTNHGENMPDLGYTEDGHISTKSTEIRKSLTEEALQKEIKSKSYVISNLQRHDIVKDNRLAPFRLKPKRGTKNLFTTSQLLFDIHNLKMTLYTNSDLSEYDGFRSNLPYKKSKINFEFRTIKNKQ